MAQTKAKQSLAATPYPKSEIYKRGKQRSFTGIYLDQVAFPLGGIGAGQINLGGSGQLQDFSIFNKPAIGEQPRNMASIHARVKGGEGVTRVIQGPVTHSRVFNGGKYPYGGYGPEGLPRMKKATFRGEFPYATIDFEDKSLPLEVSLEAFSPFVPLDVKNSAIPCGILRYTFRNRTKQAVDAQFAYNTQNPFSVGRNFFTSSVGNIHEGRRMGNLSALLMTNEDAKPGNPRGGTFVVAIPDKKAIIQETWFQSPGAQFVLWKELAAGKYSARKVEKPSSPDEKPLYPEYGGIGLDFSLKPSESKTIPLIIAWHVPDADAHYGVRKEQIEKWEEETGQKAAEAPVEICADGNCGCGGSGAKRNPVKWHPYYVKHWKDACEVARYVDDNMASLEARTRRFHDLLFGTTFPSVVLDAVSANLGILKSPTCLLLDDGQFWGYEGCGTNGGCCTGSCTHVWNYAQALPHLFPELERTLRSLELEHSMDEKGHVQFRSALPAGQTEHFGHAAADGQLGGIMKVWREWQICGDDAWLKRMYPLAKKSLDWCIENWDPKKTGALFEPHHNTYDIEFWGPDSMCTSFYLGALRAAASMAEYLGEAEDARKYTTLADKGLKFANKNLFNGEYYFQKSQWKNLKANPFDLPIPGLFGSEAREVMKKEGPHNQYGKGCLSDGVIGQWFAELFGIPDALDRTKTRKHLESVFRYNFRSDLSEHANPARPTYGFNDEAGLLLCSWPKGGQPSVPFPYATEVWTGIEYQVASHMMLHGMVDEALTIVKGARDRYDGLNRNPWDEYECGCYYARALSVYGVFTGLSGFRYSAVEKRLTLNPQLKDKKITSFFSTASAWGSLTLESVAAGKAVVTIRVEEGRMALNTLVLPFLSLKKGAKAMVKGGKGKASISGFEIGFAEPLIVEPGKPARIQIG